MNAQNTNDEQISSAVSLLAHWSIVVSSKAAEDCRSPRPGGGASKPRDSFPARAAAKTVLKKQAPDSPEGFAGEGAGHFGVALKAVGKNDGQLDAFLSLTRDFVGQFNLKTVAVGFDGF